MCDRLDKGTPIEELCADTKHLGGHHATAWRVFYRRRFLQDLPLLSLLEHLHSGVLWPRLIRMGRQPHLFNARNDAEKNSGGLLGDLLWQEAIFQGSIGRDGQDF